MFIKILFAYEYCNVQGIFTSGEQAEVKDFYLKAGVSYQKSVDKYLGTRFVDMAGGDYTIKSGMPAAIASNPQHPLYLGGPLSNYFTDGFNNRILTCSVLSALSGVAFNDAFLMAFGKRIFKDYLKYSVFPGGDMADMTRWTAPSAYEGPETGLDYSLGMIAELGELAESYARRGDTSLYAYTTTDGYSGTQSPGNPKSLLQCIQTIQKYFNGGLTRYGGTVANSSTLINGVEPHLAKSDVVFDTWNAMANSYLRNTTIKSNYLRQASGTIPYPSLAKLRLTGANQPWNGQAGRYPGILFMFGQMEGLTNPYGTVAAKINQTLTVNSPTGKSWGDAPFALTATASSGLTPSIVVTGAGTYAAGFVTITGAGTITITVNQAGNGSYNPAAEVTRTVVVNKAQPTINFAVIPDKNVSDPPVSISATSSAGLTVTSVSNNAVLTATGTPGVFTINTTGTASITASTAATSNYLAAAVTRTFTVVNTPVVGITDLLIGKAVVPSNTTIVVNDSTKYSLFQIVYDLEGSFSPSRFVLTTGNGETPDIIENFKVYYYISSTWVLKHTVTNNRLAVYSLTFTPFAGATKLKITAEGYNIYRKQNPGGTFLYGE